MVSVSVSVAASNGRVSNTSAAHGAMPSQRVSTGGGVGGRTSYHSNVTGHRIVNAETGVPTAYRVGSLDEDLFFKVADATNRNSTGDSDNYFYDSPEHYVRHRFSRMRYSVKSKSGSAKRDQLEKERRDEMLENRDDAVIHWSLVDSRGVATEDKSRAYMQPQVNPAFSARWHSKRANRVAQLAQLALLTADE